MQPRYIQVDLLIEGDFNLRRLVRFFGDAAFELWPIRPHEAVLELNGVDGSMNKTLRGFCEVIEAFPPKGRALWDKATKRVFDIGFESGDRGRAMSLAIQPALLRRIAALGATIAITIYAVPPPEHR